MLSCLQHLVLGLPVCFTAPSLQDCILFGKCVYDLHVACTHIRVYSHVCWAHARAQACGAQRLMLGVFLDHSPRTEAGCLAARLHTSVTLACQLASGILCQADLPAQLIFFFNVSERDLNSAPHTCMTRTLPTNPSPHPKRTLLTQDQASM